MQEFNISKRTALRDINELESMGLSLYVENGRYGGYKILSQNLLTPIYFNGDEILAIFFALKSLDLLSSTPFNRSYKQVSEKLFATIPDNLQEDIKRTLNFIHYYNAYPIDHSEYLSDILKSIMHETTINIVYTQYQYTEATVQVYELFYRNGIWFFEGYDMTEGLWGIYRSDYIKHLTVNEKDGRIFSRTELKNLKMNYDEHHWNIPFKCKLTPAGAESFKKNHYPNMKLEYFNDIPHIIGKYNAEEMNYMTHYLISLGENVKILYPDPLKENYLNALNSITDNYR